MSVFLHHEAGTNNDSGIMNLARWFEPGSSSMGVMMPSVFAVLVILCSPGLHAAAEVFPPSAPLTLRQAQLEARRASPEAAQWRAGVQAARVLLENAKRRTVNPLNLSLVTRPPRLLDNANDHLWDAALSWQMGLSRLRTPRRAAATASVSEAISAEQAQLRALDEQVARAFAELAYRQRAEQRAERLLSLTEALSDRLEPPAKDESRSPLNEDARHFELVMARTARIDARARRQAARAWLASLLGRQSDAGIVLQDTLASLALPPVPDFEALLDNDPRVAASRALLEAVKLQRLVLDRLSIPSPILGISYGHGWLGSSVFFSGASAGAVAASTSASVGATAIPAATSPQGTTLDPEIAFTLSFPIPITDQMSRAKADLDSRLWTVRARQASLRAQVRTEMLSVWHKLVAANDVLESYREVPGRLERDIAWVEAETLAGRLSPLVRAQQLQRLEGVANQFESAVRELRYARAAWERTAGYDAGALAEPSTCQVEVDITPTSIYQ